MKRVWNWALIQRYHDEGHGFVECQQRFGFTHWAWKKAIQRGQLRTAPSLFADCRRKYDWRQVQAYYDEGHTFRQCQQHFGFSGAAWGKAVERGEITPRPRSKSIEQVLASKSARDCKKLKLLRDGIFKYCCSQCGIFEWLGRPLALQIDHINGIHNDWRVENLRMLCPNCHSQTPTFAGRNAKRRPQSLQDSGSAV